jgi:hypothetical protein
MNLDEAKKEIDNSDVDEHAKGLALSALKLGYEIGFSEGYISGQNHMASVQSKVFDIFEKVHDYGKPFARKRMDQ